MDAHRRHLIHRALCGPTTATALLAGPGTGIGPGRAVAAPAASPSKAAAASTATAASAAGPDAARVARCIVPAKAGGGFDLTCTLLQPLLDGGDGTPQRRYQPGGIGALTWQALVQGLRPDDDALVAFSSGTLLNLAQGRFGAWSPERVCWMAGLARDHGAVAVHRDAPWPRLGALLQALRADPAAITFATGGTIGSQDWLKTALLARGAGVSHRALRVLAFEGGGDAQRALLNGHAGVLCGDVAELLPALRDGAPLRLLAVLAPRRLDGRLQAVPTAIEQGLDLQWPILRGVYASADMAPARRAAVQARLERGLAGSAHAERVRAAGLQPLALTGHALQAEVTRQLADYAALVAPYGLAARPLR
jgi:putative tricarboxylic transport membrane protein